MSGSKDKICCSEGKILDLYFDAKSYIEGLDIISNIVIDQQMFHFIQISVWIIMLINNQIFYYHHNAKTCISQLALFNYNQIFNRFKITLLMTL